MGASPSRFGAGSGTSVRVGGTLQSRGGLLAIDEVARIEVDDITAGDAVAAGHGSIEEAISALRPDGDLYRIRFRRIGDDPRVALRDSSELDGGEIADLRRRIGRRDWAIPVLRLIDDRPAVVSTELAPQLGMERLNFKQKVRRLKALGLTESLDIGYRLSPRGKAFLASIDTNVESDVETEPHTDPDT